MKYFEKLKRPHILFPVLLIIVEVILFIANYKPGTYLIGWDNIMPEFNLKTNFLRSIYSVWQEYRGLGVLDGLAHSANLLHTIYIFILSIFLPDSMLRYVYIHLTHILGGIGFFFLLRKLTKHDKASFIGSLFYMFNLATIQMYFAPLEVFATHFAALPILALLITNALEKADKKNLFILFLASILLSQQAFVPTVFLSFGVLFGFLLLIYALFKRNIKRAVLVFLIVFIANAFWGLPYLYSGLNTGADIRESRINQFSSEEIFYRNKTFGDLPSVLSLKGFMIDTIELNPNSFKDNYFMEKFRNLSSTLAYNAIYIIFFLIVLLGAGLSLIKRETKYLPYLLTLLTAVIFLANDTPIFSNINDFIRNAFPLFGEAFRFPFTKFITLFAFCFSVLGTFGLSFILTKVRKQTLASTFFIAAIIFLSYPAFLGNFTSSYLKQKMPQDYLDLFKATQSLDPHQRVALFPVQTFWNWQYRNWGQRGSGFVWYGLPQPTLERAFDPWSPYDEQFYNEIAYAVNTQDENLFENVINKYDIKYIVLDQYVLNTLSKKDINYDSLKDFLDQSPIITKKETFHKVTLYETNIDARWIYELNKSKTKGVYPNYSFEKEDNIYNYTGNYVTNATSPSVVNLFPSLYSEKLQENLEFNVTNNRKGYVLTPKKNLPYNLENYTLHIPSLFQTEFLVPVKVEFSDGQLILTPVYPTITVNGADININEDPITIAAEQVFNPTTISFLDSEQMVELGKPNSFAYLLNPAINSIKLKDSEGSEELIYLDTSGIYRQAYDVAVPEAGNAKISITFPKIYSSLSTNNIIELGNYQIKRFNQGPFSNPYSKVSSEKNLASVELSAIEGTSELSFYLKNLYHAGSYILFADVGYGSGLPMRFYIDNDTQQRAEVEAVFSKNIKQTTVVIPKANNYFQGYGFHFIIKSVGKEEAKGSVSNIEVYPFPASFVRSLQFVDPDALEQNIDKNPKLRSEFVEITPSSYQTFATPNRYLVLSQAYDKGWAAYEVSNINLITRVFPFISGKKLTNHILANNWANGWKAENGGDTIIVYMPAYLQYLGQFITLTSLFVLIFIVSEYKIRRSW